MGVSKVRALRIARKHLVSLLMKGVGITQPKSYLVAMVGFPPGSTVKNPPASAGDVGSIPGSGRCPGEGNGNPLQYACLGNLMDRGAWQATDYGVTKSWTQLSN